MKRLLVSCLILLLFITLCPLDLASNSQPINPQPTYVREDSNLIYIGNGFIELQLQKTDGGIYSVINKETGEDYRSDKGAATELFLYHVGGSADTWYDSSGTSRFNYNYSVSAGNATLNLVETFNWSYPTSATASVVVYTNSSLSHWRLSVSSPGGQPVDEVRFPTIDGAKTIGKNATTNYLLIPDSFGSLLHDPSDALLGPAPAGQSFGSYDYPSWSSTMQMMVFGDNLGGLYLATYDTQGGVKSFNAARINVGSGSFMRIYVDHKFPETVATKMTIPYDTIVGTFAGDWHAAADLYRAWALKQWWTAQGPLEGRTDVPSWFKEGFAVLNLVSYIGSSNWNNPQEVLNSTQIVSDVSAYLRQVNSPLVFEWWGWEQYGAWANPNVFPPHDGWAAFNQTIDELHSMGVHVIVALGAGNIDIVSPGVDQSWLNCTVRNEDGTPYTVMDGGRWVYASPACTSYQDLIIQQVVTLEKLGVDGVRLDGMLIDPFDYSTVNNHPPGYGSWVAQDYIQFFKRLVNAIDKINPQFLIGSEHLPEQFIPYSPMYEDDAGNIGADPFVQEFGSQVQLTNLFYYVYNDYARGWSRELEPDGGSDSYAGYGAYHLYVQALGSTEGQAVDFADNGHPLQYPAVTGLARSIAWATTGFASDFMTAGRSLVPPLIKSPEVTLSVDEGLSPLLYVPKLIQYPVPSIAEGTWQAPDGGVGFLFVNVGNGSLTVNLDLASYVPLVGNGPLLAVVSNEDGISYTNIGTGGANLTISLPPQKALTLQMAPTAGVSQIQMEYDAFKASYISGMKVLAATTSNPNYEAALATILAAENAYTTRNYSQSISLAREALDMITSTSTSTTYSSQTTFPSTTTLSSSSHSIAFSATTASNKGGGIPEFPLQLVGVVALVTVIVLAYLLPRRRSHQTCEPAPRS